MQMASGLILPGSIQVVFPEVLAALFPEVVSEVLQEESSSTGNAMVKALKSIFIWRIIFLIYGLNYSLADSNLLFVKLLLRFVLLKV